MFAEWIFESSHHSRDNMLFHTAVTLKRKHFSLSIRQVSSNCILASNTIHLHQTQWEKTWNFD
jgi:hypothetical protein